MNLVGCLRGAPLLTGERAARAETLSAAAVAACPRKLAREQGLSAPSPAFYFVAKLLQGIRPALSPNSST